MLSAATRRHRAPSNPKKRTGKGNTFLKDPVGWLKKHKVVNVAVFTAILAAILMNKDNRDDLKILYAKHAARDHELSQKLQVCKTFVQKMKAIQRIPEAYRRVKEVERLFKNMPPEYVTLFSEDDNTFTCKPENDFFKVQTRSATRYEGSPCTIFFKQMSPEQNNTYEIMPGRPKGAVPPKPRWYSSI